MNLLGSYMTHLAQTNIFIPKDIYNPLTAISHVHSVQICGVNESNVHICDQFNDNNRH